MTDEPEAMEDQEYDPTVEPKSSRAWLNIITDAEKAFQDYQDKADNIDKLFANLERLASDARDRQFQLFWANIQVIGPSIYSRPPVPVVVPRFKERRPVPRTASELLERSTTVAFEQEDIDGTMRLIRDDLSVLARGAPWIRYETKKQSESLTERVCIEHVDRKDFLHDPARKWPDVDWVGKRSWLSKKEMRKRFRKTSGDEYKNAAYNVQKEDKDNGAADNTAKAGVWEIWCKSQNKVVWVTEGVEVLLDEGEPHLTLERFFPCPKPAYSTVQRRSLVPVPDVLFYKDQLEEINELTGRISALADAIKVRAFYPAGAGEIGDAIEAAIKSNANNQVMVPISNWAAFGNLGTKDIIIWLPIDMIAEVIVQLVTLRRQLIEDVYQITGLSDIMRGATDPKETLGAQELKSQYGSIRVRDRQDELVRVARDITRIAAEIMAENFQQKTLLEMAQMELPTDADIAKQMKAIEGQAAQVQQGIEQKIKQATSNPQIMQQAQANPEQAQQIVGQLKEEAQQALGGLQQQAQKLQETVTIDQVMKLLREQKLRPFVLDIETDSTIAADENAQKQRATEFITAVGGFLNQAITAVQAVPQVAPLMADTLKYVASQFRAGRELDATIDEFADQMKQMGQQQKPNPEADAAAQKAELEAASHKQDMEAKAADQKLKQDQAQHDAQLKDAAAKQESESKRITTELAVKNLMAKGQQDAAKHQQDMQLGVIELRKKELELAALQTPEPDAPIEAKGPSESIAFKDLPPEGQSQMAAQAGITLSPDQMAAHAAEQDAKKQAEAEAKAKLKGPANASQR